jgi:autotransporter-associated beta strand protein
MKYNYRINRDKVERDYSVRTSFCRKHLFYSVLASFLIAGGTQAATWVWNGGASNSDDWSRQQNWTGNSAPSKDGTADLIFQGTTRLTPFANDAWGLNSITFDNSAGGFTISGGQLTIQSGVTNNSALSQTIQNNIILSGAQTWNAASGNLLFSGSINNFGNLLTIDGARDTTISGPISGSGGLTKNGGGILTLSGANTFTGALTLNAGTLSLNGNERINNNVAVNFNGGALNGNSFTETLGSLNLNSDSTINLQPGGSSGSLIFSQANYVGGILTINGWTGDPNSPGTDDRIFFASVPSSPFLQNTRFGNFDDGATTIFHSGLNLYEVVPVPEASSMVLSLLGLLGFAAVRWGKRRKMQVV